MVRCSPSVGVKVALRSAPLPLHGLRLPLRTSTRLGSKEERASPKSNTTWLLWPTRRGWV